MRKAIPGILFLILYFGVSAASYFASAGRTDLPRCIFPHQPARDDLRSFWKSNQGDGTFKPGPGRAGSVFRLPASTVLMLVVAGFM
jgi:hypothetical protein